jgi:hypothetical protein
MDTERRRLFSFMISMQVDEAPPADDHGLGSKYFTLLSEDNEAYVVNQRKWTQFRYLQRPNTKDFTMDWMLPSRCNNNNNSDRGVCVRVGVCSKSLDFHARTQLSAVGC